MESWIGIKVKEIDGAAILIDDLAVGDATEHILQHPCRQPLDDWLGNLRG